MQDYRRARLHRPCAYADINPTEILCVSCSGIYQRQKRDIYSAQLHGQKAELHWAKFLGARLSCVYGWP